MYVSMYASMFVCMYVCMYVCLYVYSCTRAHVCLTPDKEHKTGTCFVNVLRFHILEKIAQRTTSYQWLGTTPKPGNRILSCIVLL